MRLLVTGGAGFIGSSFIRHVLQNHSDVRITNLDLLTYAGNLENLRDVEKDSRYRFVRGDVCDAGLVQDLMKSADAVVHFAAESHVDNSIVSPHVFQRTNVEGTLVLLHAARHAGVKRFLQVSTDEVYGSRLAGAFVEDDNLNPSSPYAASKACADLFALSYYRTYGLPVVITRSSNNFGPYQFPEKLIPLFITNLLEGKKVPLYGDGRNVRDWIYVIDNCEAINVVLRNGEPGQIYNIPGGNELSNIEITKRILAELGRDDSCIEYVADRPGHDLRYAIAGDKIRKLGWKPRHDFSTALKNTIDWYKYHQDWWKPLKARRKT